MNDTVTSRMLARFVDSENGGFFFTSDDHEQLITRTKDVHDGSVPSGNTMAIQCLLRLARFTGSATYRQAAECTLPLVADVIDRAPVAAGQALVAVESSLADPSEFVVLGNPEESATAEVLDDLRSRFIPGALVACRNLDAAAYRSPRLDHLFHNRPPLASSPTLYLCRRQSCLEPVAGPQQCLKLLSSQE